MQRTEKLPSTQARSPGRVLLVLVLLAVVLFILVQGFLILRNNTFPQVVAAVFAIVWGVGGVAALYFTVNALVETLPDRLRGALQPWVFVGPAALILIWFFAIPTVRTAFFSFFDADSARFVGLQNYITIFGDRQMLLSFRNNLLWMIFGTFFCVSAGLLIAVLADRSRFEKVIKSLIFLPMAISFVGAAIIFRFVYYYQPPGEAQIGLVNAVVTALGGQPQAWLQLIQPWNNLFMIIVMIWMQTGFAMVIFSAALKGVPDEILEAGRIDGASEARIFFSIILPYIQGTIVTVTTTVLIFALKIFDIVIAMTGGQYGTDVIATQFYRQFFANRNFGLGSAIAIVLLIAVIPVMVYNLRQMSKQEGF
jgi:alpha-glucoside transport system permease protein